MSSHTLQGPWRQPRNTSAHEKGGIHDDATAQELGFTGGTVAGSIHMEQFPPFLLQHLGEAWLENGTLSLYFRQATTDGQPVRCVGEPPIDVDGRLRMQVGMLNEQGDVVMDGTASVGPDPQSALRMKVQEVRPAEDIRVLQDVKVGEWCEPFTVQIPAERIDQQLRVITEPMAMFGSPGDAHRVPPMTTLVHTLREVEQYIALSRGDFVGLFGAIEIAYHQGQPVAGKDYLVKGRALAVGESPKTEIFWMESVLMDVETATPLVTMIKMDRVMKASSPLWADAGAG
ncbi:MAG: hypothetical protein AAF993_14160 [Pseudomonadota bacterium]